MVAAEPCRYSNEQVNGLIGKSGSNTHQLCTSAGMCIHIYIYILCVYVYTHMYTYMYMRICIHAYVYMYIHMSI